MGLTTTTLGTPLGATIYIDADANATAEVAATSAKTLYQIRLDNTLNSAATYLHIVDGTSASPGQTERNFIFYCASGATANYSIPTGLACDNGLVFWCTTQSVKTGTDSPAKAVEVRIHTS